MRDFWDTGNTTWPDMDVGYMSISLSENSLGYSIINWAFFCLYVILQLFKEKKPFKNVNVIIVGAVVPREILGNKI